MRIAVDAMGGDHAPEVVFQGVQAYLQSGPADIVLIGKRELMEPLVQQYPLPSSRFEFVHASQVIEMDEHPAVAAREKTDSSMVVGMGLLRKREIDAFMSAGNSGGMLAAALLHLGRIKGIQRPALSSVFPTEKGFAFILDVGANTDCKPIYLYQFALMGSIYARDVLGISNPKVGIVSNGEEPGKGSVLVQESFELLKNSKLNFIGNVEGKDVPAGMADVVVTDGFTGNVMIKTAEGVAALMLGIIKTEIRRRKVATFGALLASPAFKAVRKQLDYAEYGGAPLLGVDGPVIVAHGRSNAKAISSAIRVAQRIVENDVVPRIKEDLVHEIEVEAKEQS